MLQGKKKDFIEQFFVWVHQQQKFSVVLINFQKDHMIVSSRQDERFTIEYKYMYSLRSIEGLNQTHGLQINFLTKSSQGLVIKNKVSNHSVLRLFSRCYKKIAFWKIALKNFITNSQQSETDYQQLQLKCVNRYNEKCFSELNLQNELDEQYIDSIEEGKIQIPDHIQANKFLVFVNPASGKGLAQQRWDESLQVLGKTSDSMEVILTEYQGHCKDYIQGLPLETLQQYKGIILVSGDGLPHEAINAIFSRKDWKIAQEIPIGVLPGGSGNAFAKNLTFMSRFESGIESNALLIAKGKTKKIDLMLFDTQEGLRMFSFLTLAWAFISDVDLGSEHLRFLGETRFTVMGTWKAIFQSKYPARLYLTKQKIDQECISALVENKQQNSIPNINEDMQVFNQKNPQNQWSGGEQKNFKYFLIAKQPYISENYYAAPFCDMEDGMMDLQYLHSNDGWFQLVSLALNQEQGKHVDMNQNKVIDGSRCKYEKVTAFRLEPGNTQSKFSIDGEVYQAQKIQGIVLKKILNVFCG